MAKKKKAKAKGKANWRSRAAKLAWKRHRTKLLQNLAAARKARWGK